jgi:hypothetical protein
MLSICLAILRLLSERAGLYAARYVLMAIRVPHVTGLRLARFVVAAVDHLLHAAFEFEHQVPEPSGHDFCDFLFHFDSPYFLMSTLQDMLDGCDLDPAADVRARQINCVQRVIGHYVLLSEHAALLVFKSSMER